MDARLTPMLLADDSVMAAWLFGSRARGTHRPTSDVDVAVLLRAPDAHGGLMWEAEARLSLALHLEVQVVVVNRASPDLVRRVLRDGRLLVDRDPPARLRFEVQKRNEYFDLTPMWRQIRRLPAGVAP